MARSRPMPEEPPASDFGGGEGRPAKNDDPVVVSNDEDYVLKPEVMELRGRWELASVLNFLTVFEPVIGLDLKISAEEIETGLISPNSSIARLHITLLKGIPPVSKALDGSDAWVTVLCKKITPWWPWVAEGEIPLMAAKGEEISKYKGLNPTKRLLILKALCEIRTEQDDMVAYINDTLKQGTEISSFRKEKIGGDGHGASFWYDGSTIIGHRLYKEVITFDAKTKSRGKGCSTPPRFQWETLATNLEEFCKVADDLSSSKVVAEAAVGRRVETDAIPVLEKLQKKKEYALKRRQRQEIALNDSRSFCTTRVTRSCRNLRPVDYTYDNYDRAMEEAIQLTKKRKNPEEQSEERELTESRRYSIATDGPTERKTDLEDHSPKRAMDCPVDANVNGSDVNIHVLHDVGGDDEDSNYDDDDEDKDYGGNFATFESKVEMMKKQQSGRVATRP